jgi:hypothetical protein
VSRLGVDPDVLRTCSRSFDAAGAAVSDLGADAALADAANAVPGSRTADACRFGLDEIATLTAAAGESVRQYGERLRESADWYEMRDEAAADTIRTMDIPGVGAGPT